MSTELSHRFIPESINRYSSVEIADKIGRDHFQILRDIKSFLAKNPALSTEFQETTYRDSRGRDQKCYMITIDGITELAERLRLKGVVRALVQTALVVGERQALDKEHKRLHPMALLTMQDKAYRDCERQMTEYIINLQSRLQAAGLPAT